MAEALTSFVARGTRNAMELIYDLQACGVESDIDIPQVTVIGDQSSGKSSVLESICYVPLPRGAGLVTKCAIEIRLTNVHPEDGNPSTTSDNLERDPFWICSVFTSRDSTPVKIEMKSDLEKAIADKANSLSDSRYAGGFSKERVIVQIFATGAPNLTVIDLPGIIRTKTFGQDRNAIKEVSELIQGYIGQERTIMLVIVPATQDVATVEALEWASKADPDGNRTIGVITKPDLVDLGAENEVSMVLLNKRKPLKLGYVMIKNRSQREVEQNISSMTARRNEEIFFSDHEVFSSLPKSSVGVDNLVKKLTTLLVSRIHDALPKMRNEVRSLLEKAKDELERIGIGAGNSPGEANMTLMRIVFEYNKLLTESSAGRYKDKRLWNTNVRLCTRVRDLYDSFKKSIMDTRPPFEGDSKFIDDIEKEVRNSRGREMPGFLNPRIFEARVAKYVEDWRKGSNRLVSEVRQLVSDVAYELLSSLAPEFPGLRSKMQEIIASVLKSLESEARNEVSAVFEREVGQPSTMNEQFLAAVNAKRMERFDVAVSLAMKRVGRDNRGNVRDKHITDMLRAWYESYYCSVSEQRARAEAEDMATMLGCYWDVSAKRFVDNHVMVIDTNMIRPLAKAVHVQMNEVVLKVGTSQQSLETLLEEDPEISLQRKSLIAQVDRLTQASSLIERF